MRRTLLFALLAGVLCVSVVAGGCGDSRNAEKKEGVTMSAPSTSTPSAGNLGPDGQPVKTLADFPDGQDGANVEAVIKTAKGDIVVRFFPDVAPVTVASFLHLARSGFYNGLRFHRVVPGFVIQGGDPKSRDPNAPDVGTGGPGYYLPAEFNNRPHKAGTLSMARSQSPNSGGSQFFICLAAQPSLDNQYTVFGETVSGMEVVQSIVAGDLINEIVVQPKSGG
jgi:cyclophilin family peptidyl-prolyl cis-trans isomerase